MNVTSYSETIKDIQSENQTIENVGSNEIKNKQFIFFFFECLVNQYKYKSSD